MNSAERRYPEIAFPFEPESNRSLEQTGNVHSAFGKCQSCLFNQSGFLEEHKNSLMFSKLLSGLGPGNIVIVTQIVGTFGSVCSCLPQCSSLFIKALGLFRPWFSVLIYVVCLPREKTNLNTPSFSMTQITAKK